MIGQLIREQREIRNMSTRELSEKADISNTYIFLLEKEKVNNPSIKALKKIANALDIDVSLLLQSQE